ncbi:hypothetical protein APHAL10511_002310 [Amanita phalloides]|nr:hypothetical protein APHAL10511_002310 [Amanita phalloides]
MSGTFKRKDPEGQKTGAPGTELAKILNPKDQKAGALGTERQHAGVTQEAGASGMATTSGTATTQNLASPPHKKFKAGAQYLQAWDMVMYARGDPTTEGWGQFYGQWWGPASTGKAHFEVLHAEGLPLEKCAILVGDAHIQHEFEPLDRSKGWMIIREEYATIYSRLSGLFEAKGSGAVLTGNPGIGKSYFAVYALLRRMTEAKTTLFTTSSGFSYLFHETGIRRKIKALVMPDDLPDEGVNDRTSRAWSLIDGAADRSPEVSTLTRARLFVLITCSPKEERYKEWRKQTGGLRWVMNPWSKEELHALLSNLVTLYSRAEDPQNREKGVGQMLKSVINLKKPPAPLNWRRTKWTGITHEDETALRLAGDKIRQVERRERKDICTALRPSKTHMGGFTRPAKIRSFNWLLKGRYGPGEAGYYAPPEAYEPHTIVVLESRYQVQRGVGRPNSYEYIVKICKAGDVEKFVARLNSPKPSDNILEMMDNALWPWLPQFKKKLKEEAQKVATVEEGEDGPLRLEPLEEAETAPSQYLLASRLRETYLPTLEHEFFFRPLLTVTLPTRPLAVALSQLCKALVHGLMFRTFIQKHASSSLAPKLAQKTNQYIPWLTFPSGTQDSTTSVKITKDVKTSKKFKDAIKSQHNAQLRNLRIARLVELTHDLSAFVYASHHGLEGISRVLAHTEHTVQRAQLRANEPPADIKIEVGVGEWYACEEEVRRAFVEAGEKACAWVKSFDIQTKRNTTEKNKEVEMPPVVVTFKLDERGKRYDPATGSEVPWPPSNVSLKPASVDAYAQMARDMQKINRLIGKIPRMSKPTPQDEAEVSMAQLQHKRDEFVRRALKFFNAHKDEIARWKARQDTHVTYFFSTKSTTTDTGTDTP